MQSYFTAAISQPEMFPVYRQIIEIIEAEGHQVWHHDFSEDKLGSIKAEDNKQRQQAYHKLTSWHAKADLVVVEASFPASLNIGHEITYALQHHKPTLVLYQQGRSSLFLEGLHHPDLYLVEYQPDLLANILKHQLKKIITQDEVRFIFTLPAKIYNFVEWISQRRKLSKARYLRQLLEREMENEEEYRW